jgi:hypothetical protein
MMVSSDMDMDVDGVERQDFGGEVVECERIGR